MKNATIFIIVVAIIIAGYLYWRKTSVPATTPEDMTSSEVTTPSTDTQTNENPSGPDYTPPADSAPTETTPATDTGSSSSDYSYTNSELGFAVNFPNLVVTQKENTSPTYNVDIFLVGPGDQSGVAEENRVPNTMAIYVWHDGGASNDILQTGTNVGQKTFGGVTYDEYSFTTESGTVYHFTTVKGGTMYDVGVSNESDMSNFYLTN